MGDVHRLLSEHVINISGLFAHCLAIWAQAQPIARALLLGRAPASNVIIARIRHIQDERLPHTGCRVCMIPRRAKRCLSARMVHSEACRKQ